MACYYWYLDPLSLNQLKQNKQKRYQNKNKTTKIEKTTFGPL